MALTAYHAFLPISQATETELRNRLSLGNSGLIAHTGVADPLLAASGTSARLDLPKRYIVAPTGGDSRKNLLMVVAAEALNRARGMKANHIVVVGHLTGDQKHIVLRFARRSGLSETDIVFLCNVSAGDLKRIYRRALICVVPSFAEGFSIPVVEALDQGTAVVASDIPSHRELLGPGPWLAGPSSVIGMARAMRTTIKSRQMIVQSQTNSVGDTAKPDAVGNQIADLLRQLLSARGIEPPVSAPPRRRLRIAAATPWPPDKSGVADYSRHTLERVSDIADVTILTNAQSIDGESMEDGKITFRAIDASAYLDPQYDSVLTVLGNSYLPLAWLRVCDVPGRVDPEP